MLALPQSTTRLPEGYGPQSDRLAKPVLTVCSPATVFRGIILIHQCDPALGEGMVALDIYAVMLLMCVIPLLDCILSRTLTDLPPP